MIPAYGRFLLQPSALQPPGEPFTDKVTAMIKRRARPPPHIRQKPLEVEDETSEQEEHQPEDETLE